MHHQPFLSLPSSKRATFSAAAVNALDLRNLADAILVGAPSEMRPHHYGDHGGFRLPNSAFRVSFSTLYYRLGADTILRSALIGISSRPGQSSEQDATP
ncbi:MAG: hypothetical protein H0V18_13915 [Pyrinomonadaceae bacterium]|nr:hypothetical protein [Pyrinomonadaceae bacterium]